LSLEPNQGYIFLALALIESFSKYEGEPQTL